jgi:NADH-quinone oxidoreductase subunit G
MPDRGWITFSIDGREVRAPEGEWLLDAAKRGDVEIPYFCYEKKLGAPVGACRMCMVEVEGIPKLQTSCSTPVKDGMVVHTQTDRVKDAQSAVVEFLLVNHPLDCPVCDKGGECPLQDISYGWGPGRSRFVDDKRNFPKPIALSPLIAIDRERCILCYRCVRFSQEVAEDEQLVFVERADHTFVGTFDGHPYVAPFSGNVIELCPVGALTNTAYRFRARPWDIEGAGSVCNLCPSQCNVEFTVRDERVERVRARDNPDVDDGWLCDKGRWGYQAIASEERITQPLIRDGGALRPTTWEKALDAAAAGLAKAGAGASAIVGGSATNEEAYLVQRIFREALGSGSIDSCPGGALPTRAARSMTHPDLGAAVADLDRASAVLVLEADPLEEAPILDLRVRKAVRRFGARLVVASSAPTALDGGATEVLRFAPGAAEALLRGLQKALVESAAENGDAAGAGEEGALAGHAELAEFLAANQLDRLAERAGVDTQDLLDVAALLTAADNVIVVWGERLGFGERGPGAVEALLDLALLLGLDAASGSGMLEIPSGANGRGLREVGCLPGLGPGLADAPRGPDSADAKSFYLLHVDPVRELPGQPEWEAALDAAPFVVAHAQFLGESLAHHADVVFPGEAYAEKEGTLTHPDGRLQRLRPSIGHPGEVRMEWQVLIELARRLGLEGVGANRALPVTAAAVFAELSEQVPFYRGLTLDDIGGDGLRWPAREQSAAAARQAFGELGFSSPAEPPAPLEPAKDILRLAPRPALWASPVIEHSPSLRFLAARQVVELNPLDAERLGLASGDETQVSAGEQSVMATVRLRRGVARGTAAMLLGTAADNANLLADSAPVLIELEKMPTAAEAAVGLAEGSP